VIDVVSGAIRATTVLGGIRTNVHIGDIVEQPGGPVADADGVLVISVWRHGAGGAMLARITGAGTAATPDVRAVTSADQLHSALDEWLAALGI
jgi:hypothetical protein